MFIILHQCCACKLSFTKDTLALCSFANGGCLSKNMALDFPKPYSLDAQFSIVQIKDKESGFIIGKLYFVRTFTQIRFHIE